MLMGATHQRVFTGVGECFCCVEKKKLSKAFCGSRGNCEKADKVPQVMSLDSAMVEAEDYKLENGKQKHQRNEFTRPHLYSRLEIQ